MDRARWPTASNSLYLVNGTRRWFRMENNTGINDDWGKEHRIKFLLLYDHFLVECTHHQHHCHHYYHPWRMASLRIQFNLAHQDKIQGKFTKRKKD